jgi:energy-coupling factor transporter ATP-binding protein EcfA2
MPPTSFVYQTEQITQLLPTLTNQFYRLLLVVGQHGSGKTHLLKHLCRQNGPAIPYLNLNLTLSRRLLELTSKERPLRMRHLLAQALDEQPATTLALDNIELLFEPSLRQEPLTLLQQLSRVKSLIVAWPGSYDDASQVLTYAEPGHPEYRRYQRPEAIILGL